MFYSFIKICSTVIKCSKLAAYTHVKAITDRYKLIKQTTLSTYLDDHIIQQNIFTDIQSHNFV